MTKVDFFGHWFYASLFLGMLLLSAKDYRGWAFRFVGEVGWIGIGLVMGMSSIIVWGLAFMIVDAWGYQKWQAEQEALAREEQLEDAADKWPDLTAEECERGDFVLDYIRAQASDQMGEWLEEGKLILPKKKVKKNVKRKAKRNPPVKRKGQGKKVAAKRSRPANSKVRAGGRRPRK